MRDIYPDASVDIKDADAPEGAVDADGTLLVGEYIDRVADIIAIEIGRASCRERV